MQINTQTLFKELAEKHQTSESEVKNIEKSVFEFVREIITNEPDKAVRLKRFGIFVPKTEFKRNYNNKKK